MGMFYDKVIQMRKDGKSYVETNAPKKSTYSKPKESAVKKDDKSTGRKS